MPEHGETTTISGNEKNEFSKHSPWNLRSLGDEACMILGHEVANKNHLVERFWNDEKPGEIHWNPVAFHTSLKKHTYLDAWW
jgi:hypothetical protein